MASNAKFEIEIYGNTAKFENSLKGINTAMSGLKGEANALKKALALDPTNTDKMAQLQKNLQQQLTVSKNKATQLKQEIADVDKSTPQGQAKWTKLQRDLANTTIQADQLEADIKDVDNAIKNGKWETKAKIDMDTSGVDSNLEGLKSRFNGFKEIAIGAFREIGSKITGIISSSLGSAIGRFDVLQNYPKIMKQMGYSTDDTSKSIDILKKGVDGLPTSLQDLTKSGQSFAILQKSASKGAETAVALNDAFLASGASAADASRGVEQYSQMLSSGSVDLQSWKTLQETMPFALTQVAKSFGITGKSAERDLYAKLKSGDITMEQLNERFVELDKSAGGFAKTARTASGGIQTSFTNLNNSITNGLATTIEELDGAIKEATGTGIAGHLDELKGVIKEVFASINEGVKVSIPPLIKGLSQVIEYIQKFSKWLNGDTLGAEALRSTLVALAAGFAAFKVITTVVSIFNTLKTAIATAKVAMIAFNAAIAANPIAAIAIAIAAVVAGLIYFFTQTETGKKMWQSFVALLASSIESIKQFFAGLGTWFSDLWNSIVETIQTIWGGVVAVFQFYVDSYKAIFNALIEFFTGLWAGIVSTVQTVWNGVTSFFGTVVQGIMNFFQPLINFYQSLWNLIVSIINLAVQLILAGVRGAVQLIQKAWQVAGDFINSVWQNILNFFNPIINTIQSTVQTVTSAIGSFFSQAWQTVSGVWGVVASWFGNIFNSVKTSVSNVFNAFGQFASNAWNAVTGVFSSVGQWFGGVFDSAKQAVSNALGALGDIAKNAWNSITNVFSGVYDFFADAFGGVKDLIDSILGGISGTLDKISGAINGVSKTVSGMFKGSLVEALPNVNLSGAGNGGITQNSASADNRIYNTFTIGAENGNIVALAREVTKLQNLGRA